MKNNIKLVIGYYVGFISYWVLEFYVFDRYYNERLSGIFSHIYLYFIVAPIFIYFVNENNKKNNKKNSKKNRKKQSLKINAYINILILQSGLSVVVLKLFSIFDRVANLNINFTFNGVNLFTLLLIAPLFEEFLYRKIILNSLKMGKMQAIIWSSFLFASVHVVSQGFKQMFYTMVLGVIWGYLATNGVGMKSLVFFHSFSNFWSYILPITLYKYCAFGGKVYNVISGIVVPIIAFIVMGCLVDKFKNLNGK
ncbi:MAG: CPBP family intramembrane metalloprotease [Endomicrobium sp.]|jgi:membrane protease YdiL (CAAX protease family)|nr:CPBP family intramembrane metalloprotease [Endomicrobium sp.]